MKIGVDVRSLLESQRGGVSEYTEKLLRALLRQNTKHHYVLFQSGWNTNTHLEKDWDIPGASVLHLKIPHKILNTAFSFGGGPALDIILGGVDVFWAPNLQFFSFSKKCRTVITCHDLSFEHYREFLSLKRRLWHRVIRPQTLYERFDMTVAVSEATADDLLNVYQLPSEKIRVIHSGVTEASVSDEDIARVKRKYNLPHSFILSLGTLEPRKNLIGVLSAFDFLVRTKNIQDGLVVVGAHGWNYGDILKTFSSMNSRHHINFLGYVDEKDKPALYRCARVLVWPSFYEGFGFPPLEALAQGTPVIVGHHSSFPEIVGEGALMVDPYNVQSIARVLYELLTDEELRREMKERGKDVVKNFSWEKTASQMEKVFEEVGGVE